METRVARIESKTTNKVSNPRQSRTIFSRLAFWLLIFLLLV